MIGELVFLFPIVVIVTIWITDRWRHTRNKVAFLLAAAGAYPLVCSVILSTDVAADIILWDDAEYPIFNWLILGLVFQALAFHTARKKWPLAVPNLLATVAVAIESTVHPTHWRAVAVFAGWTLLFTVIKKRGF